MTPTSSPRRLARPARPARARASPRCALDDVPACVLENVPDGSAALARSLGARAGRRRASRASFARNQNALARGDARRATSWCSTPTPVRARGGAAPRLVRRRAPSLRRRRPAAARPRRRRCSARVVASRRSPARSCAARRCGSLRRRRRGGTARALPRRPARRARGVRLDARRLPAGAPRDARRDRRLRRGLSDVRRGHRAAVPRHARRLGALVRARRRRRARLPARDRPHVLLASHAVAPAGHGTVRAARTRSRSCGVR